MQIGQIVVSLLDWLQIIGYLAVDTARTSVLIEHSLEGTKARQTLVLVVHGGGKQTNCIVSGDRIATGCRRCDKGTNNAALDGPDGSNQEWTGHHGCRFFRARPKPIKFSAYEQIEMGSDFHGPLLVLWSAFGQAVRNSSR